MRELSIEQKAHYYDEAIKVANKYKDTHIMFPQIKDEIFPELAESEDEEIRKSIIAILNNYVDNSNTFKPKMLAWLKKQCEQKLCVNDNAKEMFIKALERVEEQNNKGYKLTDCDKNSWWEDFKAYASCTIEQKPWSEEDDAIRNDLINYFRGSALETSEKEVINWLKSLKNRTLPQSKQEWSDVDKDILFRIIDDLKFLRDDISKDTKYAVNIVDVEHEINWLESIKYRYTWKPSDGQLNNILDVLSFDNCTPKRRELLESLYNDLRKLRE